MLIDRNEIENKCSNDKKMPFLVWECKRNEWSWNEPDAIWISSKNPKFDKEMNEKVQQIHVVGCH
jgi:hypothetical protein